MTRNRAVLPPALCQRIYDNFVRYPWISLKHILDFELYEVVLWSILPRPILSLKTPQHIIQWLMDPTTLEHFKSMVIQVVEKKECYINPHAITPEDWRTYVVQNTKVHDQIRHWRTGALQFTHPWSFLHLSESGRDKQWRLLILV